MILFLLWPRANPHSDRDSIDAHSAASKETERVGLRLQKLFGELFESPPPLRIRTTTHAHLAYLDIPVNGWNAPYFQEDEERWVLAVEPPLNPRQALSSRGVGFDEDNLLLVLAQQLEANPLGIRADIAPPFSLLCGNKRSGEVRLHTDGLGQAQTFRYGAESAPQAFSNRISAFAALQLPLHPVAEEWATRLTIGWFTESTSGFNNVTHCAPGSEVAFGPSGVSVQSHDVISSWVHPEPMSEQDCVELAESSLVDLIRETNSMWSKATMGLSGGWDSRAITGILRHHASDYELRVRGLPHRFDVMISAELAKIANMPLRIKPGGGLPPDTLEECRECIAKALLWQSGYIHLPKNKTFLVDPKHLGEGMVNLMGSHSGFGKGDFAVKIGASQLEEKHWESRLAHKLCHKVPPFMKPPYPESVVQSVRRSFRAADNYGVEGLHRFTFFFMYEYTRRWAAASIGSEINLTIAPFLNPGYMRACFAYPAEKIPSKPFHKHIIAKYAPDWADYPYDNQAEADPAIAAQLKPVQMPEREIPDLESLPLWKRPYNNTKKYHYRRYWKEVAKGILHDAYKGNGSDLVLELFDPPTMKADWRRGPDAIAVAQILPGVLAQLNSDVASPSHSSSSPKTSATTVSPDTPRRGAP